MKLFVKNKVFTAGGSSFVLDENNNKVFKIKGKFFSITRKKKIYDMDGNLLFVVRNKYWNFFKHTCFVYNADKEKILQVTYHQLSFKNDFFVEGFKDEISFTGKYFQFPNINMKIQKNGVEIGSLVKNFSIVRDAYTLDVNSEEDAALFVAITIAIDNIFDERRHNSNKK